MGTLRYGVMTCSLDGYVADADGSVDFASPSEELHAFVNDLVRDTRVFVMGRRMFETMRVWDTWPTGQSAVEDDFAEIWAGADKVVCSDSLTGVEAPRTTFEPRLTTDRLGEIVAATDGVVEVSGPTTAAEALRAGMVDELLLLVTPEVLGAGLPALPDVARLHLALTDQRAFDDGTVYLRYARR
ncbi:dihydrofolate reductase family protein [Isoptericola variabilis]|uniref:Bifunctional deaminase-reductase domain protein n=1 Tax=Isoptericola variabilis (strain 225) TaxID=743718 RepID=F6FVH1_ISOV2|nr:dihydrofolate reductase family protein [Isoptericola variabilis]AEG44398.1 bifunctional deaminase-reductase domain protein [Isoptericola variabilis 225]TWH34391.1 dihydrofolate reductase [Isoptericola variabilis J7]